MNAVLVYIAIGASSAVWFFVFDRIMQNRFAESRKFTRLAIRFVAYLPAFPLIYVLDSNHTASGAIIALFISAFGVYEVLRGRFPIKKHTGA